MYLSNYTRDYELKDFTKAYKSNKTCKFPNDYKPYIVRRMESWLYGYLACHSKAFFVRMNFTFPVDYAYDYKFPYISRTVQKLSQFFVRRKCEPSYFWCREKLSSPRPHFHVCLLLNGHRIQSVKLVTTKALSLWQSTLDTTSDGIVNYDFSIAIRKNETGYADQLNKIHEWALYLCKSFSKLEIKNGYRDFGMCRLRKE